MPLRLWASLLVAAASCLTLQDLRDAECRVGCLSAGYDAGWFDQGECLCAEKKSYERFKQKRLTLPRRSSAPTRQPPPVKETPSIFD